MINDHEDELNDQVERIERDSGDTYGCQPSPGPAAEVKVHVIREGGLAIQTLRFFMCNFFLYCVYVGHLVLSLCVLSQEKICQKFYPGTFQV